MGIPVADAADVARGAAGMALLENNFVVLEQGVREGKITFANTYECIFMVTSANFGSMFSMTGAALVVLVVRTRQPFFRSRPSRGLLGATLAVVGAAVVLPYVPPAARLFGFVPLPPGFLPVLAGIVGLYILTAEMAKARFYREAKKQGAGTPGPGVGTLVPERSWAAVGPFPRPSCGLRPAALPIRSLRPGRVWRPQRR